jgi:hypothetical protein
MKFPVKYEKYSLAKFASFVMCGNCYTFSSKTITISTGNTIM